MMQPEVIHGDCRTALAGMPAGAFDAVVTDPPYGLSFMGKEWDTFPTRGRGTRLTGSGNPTTARGFGSNVNYGKTAAESREFQAWCQEWASAVLRALKPGGYMLAFGGTRTYHRLTCAIEDAGFEVRDCLMWLYGTGFPKGAGCLKPGYEPIVLARAPGPKVLPLGIDECRVPCEGGSPSQQRRQGAAPGRPGEYTHTINDRTTPERYAAERPGEALGRYPANVLHDGSPEVLEAFAAFGEYEAPNKPITGVQKRRQDTGSPGKGVIREKDGVGYGDCGSRARFFYAAKASKAERGAGNTHPTVKPLSLMRWCVRLVCPPGGRVLDPFAGSGTTLVAAAQEGRQATGVELDAGHCDIIRRRLASVDADLGLFNGADE